MNEDIRSLILAIPQIHHGGKSFPVVILLVFAPLPLFELGLKLRLPSKLSESALGDAPFSALYPYHGSGGPRVSQTFRQRHALENESAQGPLFADIVRPTELAFHKFGRLNFSAPSRT